MSPPSSDEETDLMILNIEDKSINNDILETKERIFISLCLFALRYSLAAMFWDRDVRAYEELLDSYTDKTQQKVRKLFYEIL